MRPEQRNRPAGNGAVRENGSGRATSSVRERRDTWTGMQAAELNSYTPHAELFLATVAVLSNSRVTFTIDDVLEIMGHPVLGSTGAHGALMAKAAKATQIVPDGFTYSARTGGVIRVWRGAGSP